MSQQISRTWTGDKESVKEKQGTGIKQRVQRADEREGRVCLHF